MFYKSTDLALLLLRVGFGGLMLFSHGWGKLMKVVNGDMTFGDPLGIGEAPTLILAVLAEVGCSLLVILGLFTRAATVPLILTMLVAILFVHISDPFNKMEFALLYLIPFLALFFAGPGRYSLDAQRSGGLA